MHFSVPSHLKFDNHEFWRPPYPSPLSPKGARGEKTLDSRPSSLWGRGAGVRGFSLGHLFILAALVFLPGSAFGAQARTTLEKVGSQVYCQCGCVTTLNHCPHLPSQCQSRAQLTADILKDIQQGKDEPSILQDLAIRYGVGVLASPPTKGFDLAVWVLPGFGLVIGLLAVVLIVRHLRRKPSPEVPTEESLIDAKIMAAVEEEMGRTVPSVVNDK
jgi:cytochrome c-type biogenesis protein CcmH/NrfF